MNASSPGRASAAHLDGRGDPQLAGLIDTTDFVVVVANMPHDHTHRLAFIDRIVGFISSYFVKLSSYVVTRGRCSGFCEGHCRIGEMCP